MPPRAAAGSPSHIVSELSPNPSSGPSSSPSPRAAASPNTISQPLAPGKLSASIELSIFGIQEILSTQGMQRNFTAEDVQNSTGTFGDLPRFIQTLAGVVSDNDQRNDFLVRGGNPSENLFVIDNIEIPSINQLALSDTTGGLVSMLDNNAVKRFSFQDDAYSSRYDQRLSSVVDISTRTYGHVEPHREIEAGIAGAGGSQSGSFGSSGSYFLSARTGVLQYLTDDIGLNGTPHYRNALARAEGTLNAQDSWWGMSLFGIDSIRIHPDPADPEETNPFDIQYSGWRSATGINWQHIFSPHAFAVASAAHTEQTQDVAQTDQLQGSALVYNEHSRDSLSTVKYDATLTTRPTLLLELGARGALDQIDYSVDQPLGLLNPYSSNPQPSDPGWFGAHHPAFSSALYADATWSLAHGIRVAAGERFLQWTLDGRSAWTTRASISGPVFGRSAFLGYAEHAQLPPELYLLAFNNLDSLRPIRSRQLSAGVVLLSRRRAHLTLNAYNKTYSNYPVAAAYPQLSLANIADTFGQAFLLFPMTAQGTGLARGVEITANLQPAPQVSFSATAAYARSWYSGQDGVLRRGNYDIPLAGNIMGWWRIGKELTLSGRFNLASGRAYTPDNLPLSLAQNRDVYDLNRINAVRSGPYQRLDVRFEQAHTIGKRLFTWYLGMDNVLNHENFYSQLWEPRILLSLPTQVALPANADTQAVQHQLGRFPDAGVKLTF